MSGLLILFCWNSWFHFRNWDLSAEEMELWATRYKLCGTSGRIALEALKSVAHSSRCVCAFRVLDWGNLERCVWDPSAFLACLPYPLSLQGPSSPGTACSQINQACLHLPGWLVSCSLSGWVPMAHFGLPGKGGAGRVEGRRVPGREKCLSVQHVSDLCCLFAPPVKRFRDSFCGCFIISQGPRQL